MDEIGDSVTTGLERFVVLMHDRTIDQVGINEAKKNLLHRNPATWRTCRQPISNVQAIKPHAGTKP